MDFEWKDKTDLGNFYKDLLQNNFFRFWNEAVDRQNGGVFNCYNNAGTELVSKNKYTWSQGRFVWIWSRLYSLSRSGTLSLDLNALQADLEKAVGFLEKKVFMPNGNCVFLTDEKGNWIESIQGKGYDTSFYADCFVALGFSEYARVFKDRHYADLAFRVYRQTTDRIHRKGLRSEPYPIPEGYKFHSVPMIMLNVSEELALTLGLLDDERHEEVERESCDYMREVMEDFYNEAEGRIVEVVGPGPASRNEVLCRHVNPGHAIEDMWFVMSLAKRKKRPDYIGRAATAVKSAIEAGWDTEFGGLFRFTDATGGQPKGAKTGDPYETLILDTWDSKLWWPHSEMLYTTLLSYALTKDREFASLYNMAHEYVFNTFPDKENDTGEWVQIRDRIGNPIEKVVALPVKDPYHIMRNIILIIELLEQIWL